MTELGNTKSLKDLYNLGAITGMKTISFNYIGGSPNVSVEAEISDTSGKNRGNYWLCDIDEILNEARNQGETGQNNPNFSTLVNIRNEMYALKLALGHLDHEKQKPNLPPAIQNLFSHHP